MTMAGLRCFFVPRAIPRPPRCSTADALRRRWIDFDVKGRVSLVRLYAVPLRKPRGRGATRPSRGSDARDGAYPLKKKSEMLGRHVGNVVCLRPDVKRGVTTQQPATAFTPLRTYPGESGALEETGGGRIRARQSRVQRGRLGTTNTSLGTSSRMRDATLPISACSRPVRPCVPAITRSVSFSFARTHSPVTGSP